MYPTFYSKLYVDLRDGLAATAIAARTANQGVWDQDATLPGFRLNSRRQLTDELVILPKLFPRLAEYLSLEDSGKVSLAGFPAFLAAHNDRLFTVPAARPPPSTRWSPAAARACSSPSRPNKSSSRKADCPFDRAGVETEPSGAPRPASSHKSLK